MTPTGWRRLRRTSLAWRHPILFVCGLLVAFNIFFYANPPLETYVQRATADGVVTALDGQVLLPSGLHVLSDQGGSLLRRVAHVTLLRDRNIPVHVEGFCISACVLLLALPNTCTEPDAFWMIHRGSIEPSSVLGRLDTAVFDSSMHDWAPFRKTRDFAYALFPSTQRTWLTTTLDAMQPTQAYWLTGQDFIDAGWTSACTRDPGAPALDIHAARAGAAKLTNGFVPPSPLPSLSLVP